MSESLSFLFFIFWYRSLPRGVAVFCLSMRLSLCVILSDCLSTDFAGGQTGRQARLAWLWGWRVAVDRWLWGRGGRAGVASQPLPSGDPDVRPWLLLNHCLYFVIDLFKAVPFHDSCSGTQHVRQKERKEKNKENEVWVKEKNDTGSRKLREKSKDRRWNWNIGWVVAWG